jgi:hypothetical protein
MGLKDILGRLKRMGASGEPLPPPSAPKQLAHFSLSLLVFVIAIALLWFITANETRRSYTCDAQRCMVFERDGLFDKPYKAASATKPVTFELKERPLSGLSVLMVDAQGESDWITPALNDPALAKRVMKDLPSYRDGDDYVIAREGLGFEWYILAALLLLSSVLNLRTSLRWLIESR